MYELYKNVLQLHAGYTTINVWHDSTQLVPYIECQNENMRLSRLLKLPQEIFFYKYNIKIISLSLEFSKLKISG